jgi:hypothetical protein
MNAPANALTVAAVLMLPATMASAEPEVLFPPATAGCYVGIEMKPAPSGALPYRKPAVPVTAVRIERSYPELAYEEEREQRPGGERLINLRVIVTFADTGKAGLPKRYTNGPDLLSCTADLCDANNYKVERQADGAVLLRMTGGMFVGGGAYQAIADRRLPDGHVYRLVASPMAACR